MELIPWFKLQWDRVLGVALMIGGGVLILVGWIGASGEVFIANQVPYVLSGGLGGLAILVVGATLWLSADLSDEWRTLDRIDAARPSAAGDALEHRVRELEERVASLTRANGAAVRREPADQVRL